MRVILALLYIFLSIFEPEILGKISLFIVGILYLKNHEGFRLVASIIGTGIFIVSFLTLLTYSIGIICGYDPREALTPSLLLGLLSTIDLYLKVRENDR
ncbi:hypothetical protein [Methanocaldococcus infernus]|uniref:Uncharacterized protein n=1 Tax=Methanocaldococcus infernus (strain DSM 11812 / JCM 15783 / ME) TaxID=573063 RepID=D5VST7_METIM|nr:hypothetical protein [Methanocaldococcus infernus]ADG13640.1 hypothetical protein Metin_0982 [Methanocaldococcus infernus ME]